MAADKRSSALSLLASGLVVAMSFQSAAAPVATRWPLGVGPADATFTVYQPQVDRWDDERFEGRAAVSLRRKGDQEPTFGVVWLRARTSLERVPGQVALEGIEVVKASFPWERDGGWALLESLRSAGIGAVTVPLASLNASPAVSLAERRSAPAPPRPAEPRVFVASGPAVLILVDGDYVIRPVPETKVLRVVNSRSLLLQDAATSRFYLPMGNVWLVAAAPNGKWSVAKKVPSGLDDVRKAAAAEPGAETYARPGEAVAAVLRAGRAPAVFVSTTPAVLASKGAKGAAAPAARAPTAHRASRPGDLFAGPDGNVYRTLASGAWEKTNGRDWYPLQSARKKGPPSAFSLDLVSRLDLERRAREAG
jgi:hypothetical protein